MRHSEAGELRAAHGSGRPRAAEAGQPQEAGVRPALSEEQRAEVAALRQRDREVRAHELAHMAAGGQYVTRGASFSFRRGPDGQTYAVGGEVGIDTSPVPGDPAATLRKALAIQRAALAPLEPSGQDRNVAARAAQMAAQARMEVGASQPRGTPSDGAARYASAATPPQAPGFRAYA